MKKITLLCLFALFGVALFAHPVKSMLSASENRFTSNSSLPDNIVPVEYIQGTGSQWIDLEIYGTENTIAQIGVMPTAYTSSVLFGVFYANRYLFNFFVRQNGHSYLQLKDSSISTSNFGQTYFRMDIEIGNNYVKDMKTGDIVLSGAQVPSYKTDRTIKWFYYDRGGYVTGRGRIYYTMIFENDILLLSLIPVRFFDGESWVGAMYDFVSESVFLNQGTGSFLIGPDI